MSAAVPTRLPLPLRLDGESLAQAAGDSPTGDPAVPLGALAGCAGEPAQGFVDRLVAAARALDPHARAEILPADYVSPLERRVLLRISPAPRPRRIPRRARGAGQVQSGPPLPAGRTTHARPADAAKCSPGSRPARATRPT